MNPRKNNLWNIQRDLHSKYYNLISNFNRVEEGKFIENNEELIKIGNEMFDEFVKYKTIKSIKLFVDICAAPGNYSEILLDKFPESYGIGISLPEEKGGVPFEIKSKNYKIFKKDILEKEYKLEIPRKLDFGMASCVSYVDDPKNAAKLNMELILTSLKLILKNLNKDGHLIINLTFKNITFIYNLINILSTYFQDFYLWKSENVWATKNTFYFFGYNYKNNYDNKIESICNIDRCSDRFIGNQKDFSRISIKLKPVLITKINSILNVVS